MGRPDPTAGAFDWILITFDSCRHDTFVEASPRFLRRLGAVEKRYSYASWTAPAHYNLLMGLMPHQSPRRVHASEVYRDEYGLYADRLGIDGVRFADLVPRLYLPDFLRQSHGYLTRALVSLPVMNESVPLAVGFDSYELMPVHNDMAAMVDRMVFDRERPTFYLLNVGETHYPYALPDEPPDTWPRLHGVHGVARRLGSGSPVEGASLRRGEGEEWFSDEVFATLRGRQVRAVEYLDGVVERLAGLAVRGTWLTITSDHGELFGEGGFFGHGPVVHRKVLEVPFVEGRIN